MFINPRCFYKVAPCDTSFSYIDILLLVLLLGLPIFFAIFYLKFKNQLLEKTLRFGLIFLIVFIFLLGLTLDAIKDFSSFSYRSLIKTNFLILFFSFFISFIYFQFEKKIIFVLKPYFRMCIFIIGYYLEFLILMLSYLIIVLPLSFIIGILLNIFIPSFSVFYWKNRSMFGGLFLLITILFHVYCYKTNKLKKLFLPLFSVSTLFLILIILLRIFVYIPFAWSGTELEPYLKDQEYTFIQKINKIPKRGDIVAFRSPEGKIFLTMVFALPGEKVTFKEGILYINDQKLDEIHYSWDNCYIETTLTIPQNSYLGGTTNVQCKNPNEFALSWLIKNQSEIIGKVIFKK